jgi:hypothetical protein
VKIGRGTLVREYGPNSVNVCVLESGTLSLEVHVSKGGEELKTCQPVFGLGTCYLAQYKQLSTEIRISLQSFWKVIHKSLN